MPREAGRGNALDQTNVLTVLLVSPVFLLVRLSEEDNPVEPSIGRLPSTTPDQGLENDVSRGASSLCGALPVSQQLLLYRGGDLPGLATCSGSLRLVPAVKPFFSLFLPTFQCILSLVAIWCLPYGARGSLPGDADLSELLLSSSTLVSLSPQDQRYTTSPHQDRGVNGAELLPGRRWTRSTSYLSSVGLPDCPEGTAEVQPVLDKFQMRMTASPELHTRRCVCTQQTCSCHVTRIWVAAELRKEQGALIPLEGLSLGYPFSKWRELNEFRH